MVTRRFFSWADTAALSVAPPIAEHSLRLTLWGPQKLQEVFLLLRQPHPAAAAAGCGFDHQREPDLVRHLPFASVLQYQLVIVDVNQTTNI
jgi:hypothetical protein